MPRYWTMKGRYVLRRFGWDCHGLPIEHEIDKQLGVSAAEIVAQLGVAGYNAECRSIVQRYVDAVAQDHHAARPLGGFRQRLQDHGRLVHGVGLVGRQTALGQRA